MLFSLEKEDIFPLYISMPAIQLSINLTVASPFELFCTLVVNELYGFGQVETLIGHPETELEPL